MKKLILRVLLGLVVLIVIGVTVLYFTINGMAASAIETSATRALGVKTSVGSVRISLFEGRTEITDLDIANPAKYSGEFLELGDGALGVSLGSLLSDRIEVKEFTLKDINLSLIQGVGGSNVGAILDNAGSSSSAGASEESPSDDSAGKKYIIDKLEVDNIRIAISVEPISDATKPTIVNIDQIVVRDIGRKENGVTMDVVTKIILQSILNSAIDAAPRQIPGMMLSAMRGGLSNLDHLDFGGVQIDLGKGLTDLIGSFGDSGGSDGKGIGDTLKGIGKGIGDLLEGASGGGGETSE